MEVIEPGLGIPIVLAETELSGQTTDEPGDAAHGVPVGSPTAMANELGLRNVSFEVDDLPATVARLAADGYGLVGGIGQYEDIWRMAYVRGPEGIIVSLAERIG